ncbi:GGDEF domain-containing protein [Acinetobacter sp. ANC 7201]|uniref:GGDEF domain-containing protein n=1 Tax=Acinetobacter sp. ANC 7201 TaxID=3035288 RepID=UPI0027A4C9BF|nr:GGDEF domain-containing protein [Acinetobacter sp. ANC 7201]WFP96650.1 GGDEF domain-containing protein [Acinetobacter sp. ANC 7201]
MNQKLRSEHIRHKLFWSMSVIIASLLIISVPLTVNSYFSYKKSELALSEILVLQNVAELANNVSRERAPSNKVMSSTPEELEANLKELTEYRKKVDRQIQKTVYVLNSHGFPDQSEALYINLIKRLETGRKAVDEYVATPVSIRSAEQLDQAIKKMFVAWDATHVVLKDVVYHSVGRTSSISDNYTLVLLLADLRDQAGRVASTIMAAVSYQQPISENNISRSLQNQYQVHYLWDLINTLQPAEQRTEEYLDLHKKVQAEFINKGIPVVAGLVQESRQNKPYSLTGTELTKAMVEKFATVVDLQSYILKRSLSSVERSYKKEFRKFIFTLTVSAISLFSALFTLIYARKKVFTPLIEARQKILELSESHQSISHKIMEDKREISLFEAIQKLQTMLQQRDILEFQLRNIANTDVLTGVSNRLALNEYIRLLELRPERLTQTGLIIIDIDDFKIVNDRLGHIIGDQVIKFVADTLKEHLTSSELIVRYGGDEFLIIVDNTNFKDALILAENIRQSISRSDCYIKELNEFVGISVSAGVAVGAVSWMALLERADKSLLKVKTQGKNAVLG